MKCHLGHTDFPCRNCIRSRVFDRFSARICAPLTGCDSGENLVKFFDVSFYLQRLGWNAKGIVRHVAARSGSYGLRDRQHTREGKI